MPKVPAPPERLEAVSLEELCLRLVKMNPQDYYTNDVARIETEIRRRLRQAYEDGHRAGYSRAADGRSPWEDMGR
jgi:hypothetical protein